MAVFILGDGRPEGVSVGQSGDKAGFFGSGGTTQQTVNLSTTTTATTTALETTVNNLLAALKAHNLIDSDAT